MPLLSTREIYSCYRVKRNKISINTPYIGTEVPIDVFFTDISVKTEERYA
jgi:hypothetical protein